MNIITKASLFVTRGATRRVTGHEADVLVFLVMSLDFW